MKTCTRCHQAKSLENFRIRKRSDAKSNGLNATCRTCDAQITEKYRNRKRTENPLKQCPKCKIEQLLIEFGSSKKHCNTCLLPTKSDFWIQHEGDTKRCSKCSEFKKFEFFWKSKHTTDGYYSSCIECTKSSQEKCRPQRLTAQKKWRETHKEYANKYGIEWEKRRRLIDPEFRLRRVVGHGIRSAIVNNGFTTEKIQRLEKAIYDHLSYTPQELKSHIESLWEPWMNWENYGKHDWSKKTWQIDHIIPQSKLTYSSLEDENFSKCWSLSNLQPLETVANIRKSNK